MLSIPRALSTFCLTVAAVAVAGPAMAQVEVAGGIGADTMWSAADGPYTVTGELAIRAGATLTIEAGTEVRVRNNVRIVVEGALVSVGAADAIINIRGENETPGAWNRIQVEANGSVTMQHTRVANATYGLYVAGVPGALELDDSVFYGYDAAGIYLNAAGVGPFTFDGITLDGTGDNNNTGLYARGTRINFNGGFIANNLYGAQTFDQGGAFRTTVFWNNSSRGLDLYTNNNSAISWTVQRCTFYGHPSTAIYGRRSRNFRTGLTLSISRSIFENNNLMVQNGERDYPITFSSFSQNVYSGSGRFSGLSNPGNFSSSLQYAALFADAENGDFQPTDRSPARYFDPDNPANTVGAIDFAGAETGEGLHGFWYVNRVFEPETVYEVAGDVVVAPGVTMNFRPGTQFRMAAGSDLMIGGLDDDRIEIRVEGTLEADGTNSRPVSFTSAAAEPSPGDWYGIVIPSAAEAFNVAQVELGYAFRGVSLYQNDHIVAGSRIFRSSNAGIWIQGGTPQIEEVIVEDGTTYGIYVETEANVPISETTVRRNGNSGLHMIDSTSTVRDSLLHDNGQYGIYAYTNSNNAKTLTLDHATVAHNTRDGIYTRRSRNFRTNLTLTLRSTSVTHNGGVGASSNERDYPTTLSCTSSNVWGNSGVTSGFVLGNNCFQYNPLYADIENRNYEPTRWSPNRGLGVGGSHVGAIAWEDAIGPHIMGYLWEDYTFTRQDSPYPVLGDIVIPAGVNVTFEPGAELRVVAQEDGMGGGVSSNRAEIRALNGATVTMGMPIDDQPAEGIGGQQVLIRSDAEIPSNGDWYGLHFTNGATSSIYNVELRHPTNGLYAIGPAAPRVRFFRVLHHNGSGFYFENVEGANDIDVMGAFVVGPRRGSGNGLYVVGSNGTVQSSYFTHHNYGAFVRSNRNNFSQRVYLVNNTFVKHTIGLYWSRDRNFRTSLTMDVHNNIVADNSSYAMRDGQNRDYPTTDHATNNNLFGTDRRDVSFQTYTNNITTDPNVEDIDWDDVPRWWDGQVWPESLAIDAGRGNAPQRPTLDILGRPRVIGNVIDIGAWEHDPEANVEPRADPVTDSIMVPRGEEFTFDGSEAFDPDGRIASAFWTMSDGTVTPGQVVQHTFAAAGENQWGYITVVDDEGAEDHARVLANVNIRPIADAGPAVFQDEGPDESVFFDGTLSTDPDGQLVRWEWDFGDGSPVVAQQSPRHSYLSAGLYTVRLTVTDNEGLTDTDTTIATVFGNVDIVGPLVEHNELADGLPVGQDVEIRATIRDPAGVQDAVLFYRTIGDQAAQFALMQAQGGDIYAATIPAAQVDAPGVEYWIVARDGVEGEPNTSTYPAGAPADDVWDFLVVGDRDPPVIQHVPVADGQAPGQPVTVSATLTDATGIGSAVLFFRSQGSQVFGATNMTPVNGDLWSGQIPAFVVGEAGVQYYIAVEDESPIPNLATSPANAPQGLYSFSVESADQQPPVIVHQPVPDNQVEGAPVGVSAGIVDADTSVETAAVVYRAVGAVDWLRAPMNRTDGNTWVGQIPGEGVVLAGVQYYVEATDEAGNVATDPAQAPVVAHVFSVSAEDRLGPDLQHVPVENGQPENEDVLIEATAEDPSGVASMRVSYRPAGFPFFNDVAMVLQDGVWVGAIPGFAVNPPSVEYYLRATDGEGNNGYAPAGAPDEVLSFTVGNADDQPPSIVHTEIADGRTVGQAIDIEVSAFDDAGVDSVVVYYRTGDAGPYEELALDRGQNSRWSGILPGDAVEQPAMEYYIEATDASQAANVGRLPENDGENFGFTVVAPDGDGPDIAHAPAGGELAPGLPFVVQATVTDASGVAAVQLRWAIDDGIFRTRDMLPGAGDDEFVTTIGPELIPEGTAAIRYYITATDGVGNAASLPEGGENAPFVQALEQPDREAPLVEVALEGGVQVPVLAGTPVPLEVTAIDDQAVVAVRIEISVGGQLVVDLPAAPDGGDRWIADVPGVRVVVPGFSAVAIASDAAGNVGRSDPLAVGVIPPPDVDPPTVTLARVPDGQLEGEAVVVAAEVLDDTGVESATLFHRAPGGMWAEVDMAGDGDLWRGTIPGGAVSAPAVEYYVEATDAAGNSGVDPEATRAAPAGFAVSQADEAGPALGHSPADGPLLAGDDLAVSITADDPSGVEGVRVYWRVDGEAEFVLVGAVPAGGRYDATIGPVGPPAVEYYVEADDEVGNTSRLPEQGAFRVGVVLPDLEPPSIEHEPAAEAIGGEGLLVGAVITDPSGVASASLFFRQIGAGAYGEVPMIAGDDDTWAAAVPGFVVNAPGVEYFIEATDNEGNIGRLPADDPDAFRVPVGGGDVDPPILVHQPPPGPLPAGQDVAIEVLAEDDGDGVAEVTVFFRAEGGAWLSAALVRQDDIGWLGNIPGLAVRPAFLEYYLVATDLAGNRAFEPAGGADAPLRIAVEGEEVDEEPPVIDLVPVPDEQPVGVDVTIEAIILDPGVVASATAYVRVMDTPDYLGLPMVANGDEWAARVPGALVQLPGMDYYVEARDAAGNVARSPATAPVLPDSFTVVDPDADAEPPTIVHDPVVGDQAVGVDIAIEAEIIDEGSGVDRAVLYFRRAADGAWLSAALVADDELYRGTIPAFAVAPPAVQYYIEAVDEAGNVARSPETAPEVPHLFPVPEPRENDPPVIDHDPIEGPIVEGSDVEVTARVTDASGLDRVELRVRRRGNNNWLTLGLQNIGGDDWGVTMPGDFVVSPGVEYYLRAVDAGEGIEAFDPAGAPEAFHTFDVGVPDEDGPDITIDMLPESVSAGTPVPVAATITDPSGVAVARLQVYSNLTETWSTVDLEADGDTYSGVIAGALVVEPDILVVVEAEDGEGNVATDPVEGQDEPYIVEVEAAAEEDPPMIVHSPAANGDRDEPLPLTAIVTDASGVASVVVTYREGDTDEWFEVELADEGGDRYAGEIPVEATAGEFVEYYLTAVDTLDNSATDPGDAPDTLYAVALRGEVEPDPDMGTPDPDMDVPEPDMAMVDPDMGMIPPSPDGGNGGDDGGTTGCTCDAGDGGSPAPWLALLGLLAIVRPRRRR